MPTGTYGVGWKRDKRLTFIVLAFARVVRSLMSQETWQYEAKVGEEVYINRPHLPELSVLITQSPHI